MLGGKIAVSVPRNTFGDCVPGIHATRHVSPSSSCDSSSYVNARLVPCGSGWFCTVLGGAMWFWVVPFDAGWCHVVQGGSF